MIVRSFTRCSAPLRSAGSKLRKVPLHVKARRFSTASSRPAPTPDIAAVKTAPVLSQFTDDLDKIAPWFDIHGSQVRVLKTPAEFYETLKEKIREAEHQIFLSTLYIGKSENELVNIANPPLAGKC
jgi:CDP-diacylglycerol--glycerol-3-phosphate 3-phosphatidyltransferase